MMAAAFPPLPTSLIWFVHIIQRVCKRLAIHLRDEDLSSETGVGEEVNEEFMQKWHDRFRLPHKSQLEGMYFV